MAKEAANLKIGDCDVYYGEILLGYTKGGVDFRLERDLTELTVDEYGTAALELALSGDNLMIVVRLAEITTKNLSIAMPEGLYAQGTNNDAKIGIGRSTGYLLAQTALQLRLHPRNKGFNERNDDIYIWKAVSSEPVEMDYRVDEQRVLEITFRALVDESQPDGQKLGRIGDATIS